MLKRFNHFILDFKIEFRIYPPVEEGCTFRGVIFIHNIVLSIFLSTHFFHFGSLVAVMTAKPKMIVFDLGKSY